MLNTIVINSVWYRNIPWPIDTNDRLVHPAFAPATLASNVTSMFSCLSCLVSALASARWQGQKMHGPNIGHPVPARTFGDFCSKLWELGLKVFLLDHAWSLSPLLTVQNREGGIESHSPAVHVRLSNHHQDSSVDPLTMKPDATPMPAFSRVLAPADATMKIPDMALQRGQGFGASSQVNVKRQFLIQMTHATLGLRLTIPSMVSNNTWLWSRTPGKDSLVKWWWQMPRVPI